MKKHPLGQNPDFRKLFQQLNEQYSGKKPEDGQGEKDGTPEPERFDSNGNPVKKKKKDAVLPEGERWQLRLLY